ncbi:MAG TPA: cytochrome c biogenesis protein CcdA [Chloroflexia bacterium]|nr:cytochrome c biogenesis protein CcdA [Chloroflexia bacterium]
MQMQSPELYIAFAAGLLSFLSPCVLPLVPAYIGYLSGSAVRTQTAGGPSTTQTAQARWTVVTHALVFVLGFTLVFAVLGGMVGGLRDVFAEYRRPIQYVMGALLVVFGLHMIGVINIPFLNYERRLGDRLRPNENLGYLRSFLIGLGFGVGWTPCIGPTLSLIFTLSMNGQQTAAIMPFIFYSIGLGVPFVLAAFAMGQVSTFLKRITRRGFTLRIGGWTVINNANVVSLVSGALLVAMGVLVFTNTLTILAPPVTTFDL